MGDDVGGVVFGAWSTLVKYTDAATHENVTAALVEGSLPNLFETLVRTNNNSYYTHNLVSRNLFGSISSIPLALIKANPATNNGVGDQSTLERTADRVCSRPRKPLDKQMPSCKQLRGSRLTPLRHHS